MKIKILTAMAGPKFSYTPGQEVDHPDADAKRIIAAGDAVAVKPTGKAADTEADKLAKENADLRRQLAERDETIMLLQSETEDVTATDGAGESSVVTGAETATTPAPETAAAKQPAKAKAPAKPKAAKGK